MMIDWIITHWLDLSAGSAVVAITALCLRNILPGKKGKPAACAGCAGSCGNCGGCGHCDTLGRR